MQHPSSTTLTMAMGDALAVCLMKKDFKKRILLLFIQVEVRKNFFVKVDDLLKDNLPIVSRETL